MCPDAKVPSLYKLSRKLREADTVRAKITLKSEAKIFTRVHGITLLIGDENVVTEKIPLSDICKLEINNN